MRSLILTGLAVSAALSVAALASAAPAAARDYKYCLYEHNDTAGDCYYSTYAQCMASASGRVAYCNINPRYAFAQESAPRTRSQRKSSY